MSGLNTGSLRPVRLDLTNDRTSISKTPFEDRLRNAGPTRRAAADRRSAPGRRNRISLLAMLLVVVAFATPADAQQAVSFGKSFSPATIGPGSVSTLRFDIVNNTGTPVTGLAFDDNLPAGLTVAILDNAMNSCEGVVTTTAGSINFAGGRLEANASCSVSVYVTSATPGTHSNVSGDLTAGQASYGTASADLTVDALRPGFSKSFNPSTVFFGGRSTLTFTIDNSLNGSNVNDLRFADNLPDGMVIASPANASTTCGSANLPPTLTASAGASVISLFANGNPVFPALAAGQTCTVAVDVVANAAGALHNVSGDLTSAFGAVSSGMASATLTSNADKIALIKEFVDDPVAPGGTATLEFRIRNLDRGYDATNISFDDVLDPMAGLVGLALVGALPDPACGGTLDFSGGTLSLTGGSISSEGECSFSVVLGVPTGASDGSYANTTSSITADINGDDLIGGPATDTLFVSAAPVLTKEFTDDPVGAGGSATLEFTLTNPTSSAVTGIAFEDVFDVILKTVSSVPAEGFCGAGSTATFTPLIDNQSGGAIPAQLVVTNASLAANASCTFSVVLDVSVGAASGTYGNTTSEVTATVDGESVAGHPASDSLVIVGGPTLVKEFIDDPVQAGDTVTLQFTLSQNQFGAGDATGIEFTDELDKNLAGLVATTLPDPGFCGPSSTLTGTSTLAFSGGSLSVGQTCTFSVTLQVPAGAASGSYANQTSSVTAAVNGLTTTENPASDVLKIAGLALSKEFTNDPVVAGGTVTLSYTITNTSSNSDATAIFFQDDFDSALDGLAIEGAPLSEADICGAGSSLTGTAGNSMLVFQGGNLVAGASCTFDVTLVVPGDAADDAYGSTTNGFRATIDDSLNPVLFDNARDELTVFSQFLSLFKDYTNDPVIPGNTATLQFTLSNIGGVEISGIGFTDNLFAAYAGLISESGSQTDICGTGSEISGTTLLTFSGGNLQPGSSCTFSVTVRVPQSAPNGTVITNTTSEATGTYANGTVTSDPATANLLVSLPLGFAPSVGAVVVDPEPSNEGGTVIASAPFNGAAGTLDSDYTCAVDYGTGPVPGTTAGFVCTGPPYEYGDNGGGIFTVTVTVTDENDRSDSSTTDHAVLNVAPDVSEPEMTPEPSDEGSAVIASASFDDPGVNDSPFTCSIDYGDGSPAVIFTVSGSPCTDPSSHTYEDDGAYTVTVKVTDKDQGSDSATSTHMVNNVAPVVSNVAVDQEPSDEGDSVSASATFTDPGIHDAPFTCTVDYGDGAGAVAGTVSGDTCTGQPHTYGDNGNYTVTVAVTDKDRGEGTADGIHEVTNLDPTLVLDTSGAIAFPGGDAFIGRQGVPQEHQADGDDPGSDDLVFYWDLTVDSVENTHYNDGVGPDGLPSSAGTFPFAVTDTAAVTFPGPGAYEISVDLADDDGGSDGPQTLAKLVSGDQVCVRSHGFWRHQFTAKKPHFDEETLQAFLDFVNSASLVFSEEVDADDPLAAGEVFDTKKTKRDKANLEALAAWLNIASGAAAVDDVVEFEDGSTETVLALMFMIEDILLDLDASDNDLDSAKDLAEAVNYLVKPDCDETSFQSLFNYGIEVEFGDGCWVAYIPSPEECIGCKTDSSSEGGVVPGVAKVTGEMCSTYGGTYLKILDQRLEWQITNTGSESITVDRITLFWPQDYGDLRKISLRNAAIFDHVIPPASTVIEGGWQGSILDRQIAPGVTKKLKLEFGDARDSETRDRRSE